MKMAREMARDFDANALREISQVASAHSRTLERYAKDGGELVLSGLFKQLADACKQVVELQRE